MIKYEFAIDPAKPKYLTTSSKGSRYCLEEIVIAGCIALSGKGISYDNIKRTFSRGVIKHITRSYIFHNKVMKPGSERSYFYIVPCRMHPVGKKDNNNIFFKIHPN